MDIRPLLLLAKTISAEHGVNVRFAAVDTARCIYSDGKCTIELPFSNADNASLLYRGYIDHEVGHVRFTDFGKVTTCGGAPDRLANIFEDEFVERRMGALFPGSKVNLRNLCRTIFTEEHVKGALQASAMSRLFAFALYHRRSLLDPELGKWNDMIDNSLRELGVSERELQAMLALTQTPSNSTQENNQLASDLYDLFRPYLGKDLQGGESGEGQDGQPDTMPDDFSVSSRISKELAAKSGNELTGMENQLAEAGVLADMPGSAASGDDLKHRGMLVETQLDESLVSALRKRIPALLQSSRIRPCTISSRGRLYGKRLARVATLDVNVFRAPARKLEHNIEVGLLCDYSGSMAITSRILDKAVYATLVMLKTLPKVKSFAYGFHGNMYKCLCPKDRQKVTDFHGMQPDSSTPLGAAMLNITGEFARTGRRILLVTTDGRPDGSFADTREVCGLIAKMGIEIYGVGIGSGAKYLPKLFGKEQSMVIDSITKYSACLEAMLRKAMLCVN